MDIERRGLSGSVSLRKDGTPSVTGYAAMYNAETVIAGLWRERIAPGAFETALSGEDDVRALFNHDPNLVLGRTKSGTLTLADDSKGLRYDIALNQDDPQAMSVRAMIKRGDVSGSSFGFMILDDEWDESEVKRGKLPLLTIRKVELFDVSPVTFPAYPQTSVKARAKGEAAAAEIQRFRERHAAISHRETLRLRLQLAQAWQ